METQVNVDLTSFRMETRKWLEDNCPLSMREKLTDPKQLFWGGRKGEFYNKDQKDWFERMLKIGKTNAAVLPVPVCAAAITSLLFKIAGITSA